jgi:hypothetical protein
MQTNQYIYALQEGWDLENSRESEEQAADSFTDFLAELDELQDEEAASLRVFSLSGGVMRAGARTSNRIDGLLGRMMDGPSAGKYMADIDKNLDYLYTSLKLDMIDLVASDVSRAQRAKLEKARVSEDESLRNVEERLDKVRSVLEKRIR